MKDTSAKALKRDFTKGPIFSRLILFAIPLMLSSFLQVGYNMADNIIVGKFSSDPLALAAVGSTSVYSAAIINFMIGFSAGAGILVAQSFGKNDERKIEKSIHTSMLISVLLGVLPGVLGFALTRPVLLLLNTKPELIESAVLYMHIICLGIPATVIYNFGSSILRSLGDSKSSLYILAGSGLLNVLLNIFFVLVCNMTVDGVALATIISQYVSALLVIVVMAKQKGATRLTFNKLRISRSETMSIIKLGLPIGLADSLYTISAMLVSRASNTFSVETVYAKTVVQNVDTLVTTIIIAYARSSLTFVAQNYGAGNLERIKKSFWYSMVQMLFFTVLASQLILLFYRPIASLYIGEEIQNPELILDIAHGFFKIFLNTYFVCGIMNVLESMLRGLKYSLSPSLVSVLTTVGVRVVWIYFFFPYEPFNTANWLMASYSISWTLASIAYIVLLLFALPKLRKLKKNECFHLQTDCKSQ